MQHNTSSAKTTQIDHNPLFGLVTTIQLRLQHLPALLLIKSAQIIHIMSSRLDQLSLGCEIDAFVLEQLQLQRLIDSTWSFFPIAFEAAYEAIACYDSVAGDLHNKLAFIVFFIHLKQGYLLIRTMGDGTDFRSIRITSQSTPNGSWRGVECASQGAIRH
jgi:hypothetical protein